MELDKNIKLQSKSFAARLDDFVFIKKGYSFWVHLVPFSIAALLLLILSLSTDNLLLRLVDLLQRPNWIWVPAVLLTAVATAVYVVTVNVQVRHAYLWHDHDIRRTITTSLIYIFLCTLMAFGVLKSAHSRMTTFGDIWTSFLVAVLSLTGIGWSGPSSWVEAMGIKSPNYTQGRQAANKIKKILDFVRIEPHPDEQDLRDFQNEAKNLCSDIETNLQLEPKWAEDDLIIASKALSILINQVEKNFSINNRYAPEAFATACREETYSVYPEFIDNLKILGNYWHEWQFKEYNGR